MTNHCCAIVLFFEYACDIDHEFYAEIKIIKSKFNRRQSPSTTFACCANKRGIRVPEWLIDGSTSKHKFTTLFVALALRVDYILHSSAATFGSARMASIDFGPERFAW